MHKNIPSTAAKEIVSLISSKLDKIGVMYRIFSRVKEESSLNKKIESDEKYINGEAKIQDLVGIRIVLYFPDDIELVHSVVSSSYSESKKDASIDDLDANTFKPVRYNLVYNLLDDTKYSLSTTNEDFVDNTFELQIRTVFSEGWHEVEHDLRYKFQDDWLNNSSESRKLNGVYATLETSEWTMVQLLEEVAYKHYKNGSWEAMFRQRLRLRMRGFKLNECLNNIFDNNYELAKKFYRIDRFNLIQELYKREYSYPLELTNIVLFCNTVFIKNEAIIKITPPEFFDEFSA